MWVLIFTATKRPLEQDEARELRRLCKLIEEGVPGFAEFNGRCEGFCLAIFSSSLFGGKEATELGDLLLKIDDMRDLLK
jgi:hypothetical protein